jgi:bifunctional UDP-N-acetylglucosamine pyrophosphorylase / glucosamine-1-phosphate N-acetyltransferase
MNKTDENEKLAVVILAAGLGKRMKSGLPKVLHRVCGRTLVELVLDQVEGLGAGEVLVVVGPDSEDIAEVVGNRARCVVQAEPKGTGHAVVVALEGLDPRFEELLVLPGDSPLIQLPTLHSLLVERRAENAAASMLTAEMDDPSGYGRVTRNDDGSVARVVEEADASGDQRAIKEVNACTYAFGRQSVEKALGSLDTDNAQGEYYLTGVVEWFITGGLGVAAVSGEAEEALGVNDREQLAAADAVVRKRVNRELMLQGVTMLDPLRTYVDCGVEVGRDTVIMPLVFLSGRTRIGAGCNIGPCTRVSDSQIGDRCRVEFSWLDGCEVADDADIGPYSRLRPGCKVGPGCRVGSFVEIKNTVVGKGSKVPHLSYVGDAVIGEDVNVGAGSITCNYDGEAKHKTEIGDRAFIGSDTMLIAPVRVGDDAVTGAGSSIYEDIPDGGLGIERSEQKNVLNWREKRKKKRQKNK